jgi:succinate-acetate transporter protein
MENKPWANVAPLTNITIGLMILTQWSMLTGKTGEYTNIALLPWLLPAFFLVFVLVVLEFKQGLLIDATMNGLLGIVLMGQGIFKGFLMLNGLNHGITFPPEYMAASAAVASVGFLIPVFLLFIAGLLSFMGFSRTMGVCVWLCALGFLGVAITNFTGNVMFAGLGGFGLIIMGIWLTYLGLAQILNESTGKTILPIGKPAMAPPEKGQSIAA